jgi:hypothetical protein
MPVLKSLTQGPSNYDQHIDTAACFDMVYKLSWVLQILIVEKNQKKISISWLMKIMWNSDFNVHEYLLEHALAHLFT